jgi:hypothetical protein
MQIKSNPQESMSRVEGWGWVFREMQRWEKKTQGQVTKFAQRGEPD